MLAALTVAPVAATTRVVAEANPLQANDHDRVVAADHGIHDAVPEVHAVADNAERLLLRDPTRVGEGGLRAEGKTTPERICT